MYEKKYYSKNVRLPSSTSVLRAGGKAVGEGGKAIGEGGKAIGEGGKAVGEGGNTREVDSRTDSKSRQKSSYRSLGLGPGVSTGLYT